MTYSHDIGNICNAQHNPIKTEYTIEVKRSSKKNANLSETNNSACFIAWRVCFSPSIIRFIEAFVCVFFSFETFLAQKYLYTNYTMPYFFSIFIFDEVKSSIYKCLFLTRNKCNFHCKDLPLLFGIWIFVSVLMLMVLSLPAWFAYKQRTKNHNFQCMLVYRLSCCRCLLRWLGIQFPAST